MADEDRGLALVDGDESADDPDNASAGSGDGGRDVPVKRRRHRWWIPLAILLALLVLGAGGLLWYAAALSSEFSDKVHRGGEAQLPPPSSYTIGPSTDPTVGATNVGVNFVLMGVDKRDGDRGRSDSLMVAHLSGDRKNLYLISFPRDMWVTIPGRGKDKINAAFAYGGTALTVSTLQELLRSRMDHVGMIDMEGFVRLTDVIGGVTIDNPYGFTIDGETFPAGPLELSGERALLFCRARYMLPNGDLDRARNQRLVLKAIISKGLSPSMVSNPAAFTSFVGGVANTMQVDTTLTDERIRELFLSLRITSGDDVREMQAPISGFGTSPGGASIDVVDEARMAELATAIRTDTVGAYYQKYGPR